MNQKNVKPKLLNFKKRKDENSVKLLTEMFFCCYLTVEKINSERKFRSALTTLKKTLVNLKNRTDFKAEHDQIVQYYRQQNGIV